MKVIIETIPHATHRYPTVGDWYYDEDGTLHIKVSEELSDWRMQACIALHELAEVWMCKHSGVTQEAVDTFDKDFEEARAEGNNDEPGDSISAPYYREHGIASGVERILATELDLDWNQYDGEINALP